MRVRWTQRMAGLAAVLAVVVLGACTAGGGGTFTRAWPVSPDRTPTSYWSYAGGGKTVLIETHGLPDEASATALADAFPAPWFVAPPAGYTTDPKAAAHPEYRFVLVFGVTTAFSGDRACGLAAGGEVPQGMQAKDGLMAAYCYRDELLAQVRADAVPAAVVQAPASEPARQFLVRLTRYLVPQPDADDCGFLQGCVGAW